MYKKICKKGELGGTISEYAILVALMSLVVLGSLIAIPNTFKLVACDLGINGFYADRSGLNPGEVRTREELVSHGHWSPVDFICMDEMGANMFDPNWFH